MEKVLLLQVYHQQQSSAFCQILVFFIGQNWVYIPVGEDSISKPYPEDATTWGFVPYSTLLPCNCFIAAARFRKNPRQQIRKLYCSLLQHLSFKYRHWLGLSWIRVFDNIPIPETNPDFFDGGFWWLFYVLLHQDHLNWLCEGFTWQDTQTMIFLFNF